LSRTATLEKWKVDLRPDEEDAIKLGALRRSVEEAHEELRSMKTRLLESERLAMLGRMAYSISHDLRHHLAAV
jgi:C4-dicarboxylate-specific signal transduction histidine kinase